MEKPKNLYVRHIAMSKSGGNAGGKGVTWSGRIKGRKNDRITIIAKSLKYTLKKMFDIIIH